MEQPAKAWQAPTAVKKYISLFKFGVVQKVWMELNWKYKKPIYILDSRIRGNDI